MKFAHLIEINDPLNPLIDPLSREQLWRGLVLRAESPKLFMPHLDQCLLLAPNGNTVTRELHYGDLIIRDQVTFHAMQQVHYFVPAQGEIVASHLTMTIEEPQPDALFVRFEYDDGNDAATDAANAMYNEYRRSAYHEADIDTIRIIRELAAEGRFDRPVA